MMSHHVTCHVTAMSRASSSSLKRKRKRKEIQKKRNIKSRKIDKEKRKKLVSKAFHNTLDSSSCCIFCSCIEYVILSQ